MLRLGWQGDVCARSDDDSATAAVVAAAPPPVTLSLLALTRRARGALLASASQTPPPSSSPRQQGRHRAHDHVPLALREAVLHLCSAEVEARSRLQWRASASLASLIADAMHAAARVRVTAALRDTSSLEAAARRVVAAHERRTRGALTRLCCLEHDSATATLACSRSTSVASPTAMCADDCAAVVLSPPAAVLVEHADVTLAPCAHADDTVALERRIAQQRRLMHEARALGLLSSY